ncbi:unnamed protein product [Candidula unifasciata]|uniref:Uncharacterized protein n=1 Tax=Candidula unifasciata TaxID=100452 RepID=A0A8S4A1D4_9EUPU|nr:unnamed protein product [Candidula unifasciata]
MSNNSGVDNNSSEWGNYSIVEADTYMKYLITYMALDTIFAVAGTSINVWFLTAMLLSPKIRSRLRNKIICGMLVVNLIASAIICPFFIIRTAADFLIEDHVVHCYVYTVHNNIYYIQNFLSNWYIFILVCVYTAQVMNFEPVFTPQWVKMLLTAVIITSPCVFAVFFVPLTRTNYGETFDGCTINTQELVRVYKSLDTIVPQALIILLFVATAVLKLRRYLQGHSDTLRVQLIDDITPADHWYPFVALLVTAVLSDFGETAISLYPELFFKLAFEIWMGLYIAAGILNYLLVLLIPGIILLFPDIRERIKSWRPCRRSAPSADVVVTYEKNTSQLSQI